MVVDAYHRLARAQKGHARGAPAYSVYVNRRIGRVLAAVAYRIGLTPNQVSIISAVHSFVAIGLIAFGPVNVPMGLLIALLLVLGYAWDSADGQVARLRGGGSPQGEWLDHFIDTLKIASLHLGVLIGLYRVVPETPLLLLIPIVFSIVATTTFSGMLLNDLLKGKHSVASTHERGGGTLMRSLILLPTDFGLVCLVFVLWGWTPAFLIGYGALCLAAVLFLALAAVKWFREIGRLGASA
ncbi:CDP-alcohol phosphatidyltransferase family protein [Microbacterium maritypicum]|uniref:CDP-alcohol phosphatidyltransferase family protein n=1 Tax=Microbacterium maritypicum TaxID=33918 RepID=A0ACD4B7E2_MICMQ|nr:CDP-alcohol phosphatidyltransferase family protein [Microbacterium liquefaciens]MBP5800806.1 CDP-alcohol phosphatidyltransferase family protein [Microbacterium liquefaciens]UTT53511.1 CDP-alcohol phosphatidyltransferase family protein [Microbacterium liquefaciens]